MIRRGVWSRLKQLKSLISGQESVSKFVRPSEFVSSDVWVRCEAGVSNRVLQRRSPMILLLETSTVCNTLGPLRNFLSVEVPWLSDCGEEYYNTGVLWPVCTEYCYETRSSQIWNVAVTTVWESTRAVISKITSYQQWSCIGWQNLNPLSHPNATQATQAKQARASGENLNYATLAPQARQARPSG